MLTVRISAVNVHFNCVLFQYNKAFYLACNTDFRPVETRSLSGEASPDELRAKFRVSTLGLSGLTEQY